MMTRARTIRYGEVRMNSITSTRRRPCTSAECEPSGICSNRPTAISTPISRKSSGPGLSRSGSCWVRPMTVCSLFCASCTASREPSRPTKIGETMRGNTTRSRSGKTAASIMPSSSSSRFGIRYSSSVRWERVRSKLSSSSFQSFMGDISSFGRGQQKENRLKPFWFCRVPAHLIYFML